MKTITSRGLALLGLLLLPYVASAQSVFISELADPRQDYLTDRFLEIYNPGPAAVDLTGWQLVAVGNGSPIFTWSLSGTIQPGEALVAGDATTVVAFDVDFAAEAWSTSNATWNGKVGDGARLIDATSTVVDDVVAPGTLFENRDLVRVPSVGAPSPSYVAAEWASAPIDLPTEGTPGTHDGGVSLPVIAAIEITPSLPGPTDAVSVSATVTDAGATLTGVDLRWGNAPGALTNTIGMNAAGGDVWVTSSPIPAQAGGAVVHFEIEAFNDVPASATSDVQSYSVLAEVSIAAVQGVGATSPFAGSTVVTQGVVTAVYGSTFVIQDGVGPRSGLWVDGASPAVGDAVDVQGLVVEDGDGTTRLTGAQILSTVSGSVPAAAVVPGGIAFGEDYEGVLVRIEDAACIDPDAGAGSWRVDDGTGAGEVGALGVATVAVLGTRYDVIGPVREDSAGFAVEPRTAGDVVFVGDDFAPVPLVVEALDLDTVRVSFSETLDPTTATSTTHFAITGTSIATAALVPGDATKVDLTTSGLAVGTSTLTVNGVEDAFGNAVVGATLDFVTDDYGPPVGYYATAFGLTGETLRLALHQIIDDHTAVSYSNALNAFLTTDDKDNGKVWDIYSDVPGGTPPYEYTFGVDNGASASGEGQGYNREHTWPRSWFGGAVAPMNSDLFQLYPTDIYVNSIRGSFPYGEVDAPDYVSANGSRRGPNTWPGTTGTAFEPIDAYKGDLARTYFYMSARYVTEDGGWPGGPMTDGADLLPWAIDMLYAWHVADPVSAKERERNHAVYGFQGNRNPFIDHPEFVAAMFEIATSVEPDPQPRLQAAPNAPNPFSYSTSIAFSLPTTTVVEVSVYDLRGREVRRLVDESFDAGEHRISWDGRDGVGERVAAGTYFYRLRAGEAVRTGRMVLVR